MITVHSILSTCQVGFNLYGLILVVPSVIEYVTIDKNGKVEGWEDRPYFDEDQSETWSNFNSWGTGNGTTLAFVEVNDNIDLSTLHEPGED